MQNNLIDRPDQSYLSKSNTQSFDESKPAPVAQESIAKPVVAIFAAKSYGFQPAAQTNDLQPAIQTNNQFISNFEYLKKQLCCPRIWTFIEFFIHLILGFLYYAFTKYEVYILIIVSIICIGLFLVAYSVNRSAVTGDFTKYLIALVVYIAFFVFCLLLFILAIWMFVKKFENNYIQFIEFTLLLLIFLFELITLCILFYYKKKFNMLEMPADQQSIDSQKA